MIKKFMLAAAAFAATVFTLFANIDWGSAQSGNEKAFVPVLFSNSDNVPENRPPRCQ